MTKWFVQNRGAALIEIPVAIAILALLAISACLLYLCDTIVQARLGDPVAAQPVQQGVEDVNQNGDMAGLVARGKPIVTHDIARTSMTSTGGD